MPEVNPQDIDEIFTENETGTALTAEAVLLGEQGSQPSTTLDQVWVLAALAKKSPTILNLAPAPGAPASLCCAFPDQNHHASQDPDRLRVTRRLNSCTLNRRRDHVREV